MNSYTYKGLVKFFLSFVCSFITGPPNGPVLFCWLASVVVCNATGVRSAGRVGTQHGNAAGGGAGRRAVDTAWWASTVTSR